MDDITARIEKGYKFLILSRIFRSVAMIYVTLSLPLYLLSLNVPVRVVGVLFFVMISISVFISLFAGMVGDRIGYRYSLIIADVPLIFASFVLYRFDYLEAIVIATIVGGVGGAPGGLRGVFAPGMLAMIARNWPDTQKRISRMGLLMSVGAFSSVVGAALLYFGHYLLPSYSPAEEFRAFYLLSFFLAILSAIFIFITPERKGQKKKRRIMRRSSGKYTSKVFLTNLIQGSGLGLGIVLLPAWIKLRYGASTTEIGLIFAISYLATAVGSLVSTYIPLKQSPVIYGSVSRVIQGALLALMAFLPTALLMTVAYSGRQFFGGYGAPIRSAVNVRGVKSDDFGTASSIQGLGMRASQGTSVASGYLMEVSLPLPEFLGGIAQGISAILYYRLLRERKEKDEDSGATPDS